MPRKLDTIATAETIFSQLSMVDLLRQLIHRDLADRLND